MRVLDRRSIVTMQMPNRDGFTTRHGFMRADGKPDTHAKACMTDCAAEVRLSSEIPDYARDSHGDVAQQTGRATGNGGANAGLSNTLPPRGTRRACRLPLHATV